MLIVTEKEPLIEMQPLYKSTIVIWSSWDPETVELSYLARQAEDGDAYCSVQKAELVHAPEDDEQWDDTEFFDSGLE